MSRAYDALGRMMGEASNWTTRSSQDEAADRRTRLTWNDGFFFTYDYDTANNMLAIGKNEATSETGCLPATRTTIAVGAGRR